MRTPCTLPTLRTVCAALAAALLLNATPAAAQSTPATPADAAAPEAAPPAATKPTPPPYSVPWALRPAAKVRVLRTDTTLALFEGAGGETGASVATFLLGGYAIGNFVPIARLGLVGNSPPGTAEGGYALTNPMIGAWYLFEPGGNLRITPFLGLALPFGMGGGNTPDPGTAAAARSGILARSAMDNAMFAVNDLTVFPGIGVAWVKHGLTVQAETTLLQLTRVRGELAQPDSSKTNFTSGVHVGYALHEYATVSTEVRYQRWLSTPAAVAAAPLTRDNLTLAAGLRSMFKLGDVTFRPGLSYTRPLDNPMSAAGYQMFQFDMPVLF